jgi:hypothetical protein
MIEFIVTGVVYFVYGFACLWIGYGWGREKTEKEKEKTKIDESTIKLAERAQADNQWRQDRQYEIVTGQKPRRMKTIN